MNLVFSGGHITPALALMQKAKIHGDNVLVLGKRSLGGEPPEARETKSLGFVFYALPEWKYHRYSLVKSLLQIPQGIRAIIVAYQKMKQYQSHVCVVFGGYLSVPVAVAAFFRRIPVVLHEQTMNPGIGSRIAAYFTHTIFTAFPNVRFRKKSYSIGNLIRSEFFKPGASPDWLPKNGKNKPIIYITGGNQGSRIINETVSSLYEQLTKTYIVVHQCGGTGTYQAETMLDEVIQTLPPESKEHIICKSWFGAEEVAWLMHHARILIGRAGANTVSEIMVTGIPSILIPLLSDPKSEQYRQAMLLEQMSIGLVVIEEQCSALTMLQSINTLEQKYNEHNRLRKQRKTSDVVNAVEQCYLHLEKLYSIRNSKHAASDKAAQTVRQE